MERGICANAPLSYLFVVDQTTALRVGDQNFEALIINGARKFEHITPSINVSVGVASREKSGAGQRTLQYRIVNLWKITI